MHQTIDAKLKAAHHRSPVMIYLAPRLMRFPGMIQKYDEPFLPFSRVIISATQDIVGGYVFDLAAFLTLGAAGAIALERASAFVPSEVVKILHGPFATPDYANVAFESPFAFDAVTITHPDLLPAYTDEREHAAFVVRYDLPQPQPFEVFWINKGVITTAEANDMRFQVTPEHILYAEQGEDFAERLRESILELRDA